METIAFITIICIGVICELYCISVLFNALYEDGDDVFAVFSKFILSMLIGWIVVPIILGISKSSKI